MNVGLLEAKGAQPVKPSRYKPVWTDRFFTGLFTNRSPFRSPLSAYYADGWNLGRTDTLLQGTNVEVSPRLTIARRAGNSAFTAFSEGVVNNFYSFHESNGIISLYYDTPSAVYNFNPAAKTQIYTKTPGAIQTSFQGVGTQLYMADRTTPKAYDTIKGAIRSVGLPPPLTAPILNTFTAIGSGAQPIGVNFTGGEVTTGISTPNYTQCSIECLVNTSNAPNPLVSFESSGSGTSTTVFQKLEVGGGGDLAYSIFDTVTNALVQINSLQSISDGQWHHVVASYSYAPQLNQAVSFLGNTPISNSAIGSISATAPNSAVTGINYPNAQASGNIAAPAQMQVFLWIDGILVSSSYPAITPSASNGFWRIAHSTSNAEIVSEVSVWNVVTTGVEDRFNRIRYANLTAGGAAPLGMPSYENALIDTGILTLGLQYWWKLNETSGTVATDSADGNNGTYTGSYTQDQHPPIVYVPWVAATVYSDNIQRVVDTNGNLQLCIQSGTSGSTEPTWNTALSGTTEDNSVTWINQGPAGLITTISHQWCYAYGDSYGNYSTVSPLSQVIGPYSTGLQAVDLFMLTSPSDPRVSHVAVFRTVDGGSTLFYLGSRNVQTNFPSGEGQFRYWDMLPDSYCNILMAAPVNHANDQPPQGLSTLAYHAGRIWGSVNNTLYASGGPDTLVGNGNECWPPANSWTYPSQIIKLIPHTTGLIVLTNSGIWTHAGGPAISQYYPQPLFEKIGIANINAADIRGNEITIFSTDRVAFTFDLASNALNDIGYPIADLLKSFNPLTVYITYHRKGDDNALYIGDGLTGWYRCVSQQPPDYSITGPVWSPKADVIV